MSDLKQRLSAIRLAANRKRAARDEYNDTVRDMLPVGTSGLMYRWGSTVSGPCEILRHGHDGRIKVFNHATGTERWIYEYHIRMAHSTT